MVSFWNSITNEFNKVGNFIGATAHEGFEDFNNMTKSATNTISNVATKGFSTVDGAVKGVVDLGKNAENKIGGAVNGFEDILMLPLALIAGGIAYFLVSKNGGQAIQVAGNIAMKKL